VVSRLAESDAARRFYFKEKNMALNKIRIPVVGEIRRESIMLEDGEPHSWAVALHPESNPLNHAAKVYGSSRADALANADDIARAVNSHKDLVIALERLTEWGREHTSPRDKNSPHALLVAAVAALEKAKFGR
jgi:hypothetical protein